MENFNLLIQIRTDLHKTLDSIDAELIKMDWRHLANRGHTFLALKSYRAVNNCSISDAKEAVDSFVDMLNAKNVF